MQDHSNVVTKLGERMQQQRPFLLLDLNNTLVDTAFLDDLNEEDLTKVRDWTGWRLEGLGAGSGAPSSGSPVLQVRAILAADVTKPRAEATLVYERQYGMVTRVRPGAVALLREARHMFDLILYSRGSKEYVLAMAKILSEQAQWQGPLCGSSGSLFAEALSSGALRPAALTVSPAVLALAELQAEHWVPADDGESAFVKETRHTQARGRACLILDDKYEVWAEADQGSVLKVYPYHYFPPAHLSRLADVGVRAARCALASVDEDPASGELAHALTLIKALLDTWAREQTDCRQTTFADALDQVGRSRRHYRSVLAGKRLAFGRSCVPARYLGPDMGRHTLVARALAMGAMVVDDVGDDNCSNRVDLYVDAPGVPHSCPRGATPVTVDWLHDCMRAWALVPPST